MTDQERARDHAARELARRLAPVTSLADPYAAALDFMQWLIADHWRRVEPVIGPMPADHVPGTPDAYHRGAELARDLLAQKTSIRLPRKDDQ